MSPFIGPLIAGLFAGLVSSVSLAQSFTLRQTMVAAVATNPSIKAKARDVDAANSALSGAEWGRFPSVNMSVTSNRLEGATQTNINSGPTSILTVEQPLYAWGGIDARISVAGLQRDIAARALQTETNSVIDRVIAAFADLQRTQERLRIQQDALARLREFKAMIERRVATQLSSNNDMALVEARVRQALTDLTLTRSLQDKARNQLTELTSLTVTAVEPEAPRRIALNSLFGAQQAALDNAPELASSRLQIELATAQRTQRRSDIFPRLVARGEQMHTYNSQFPNDTRFYIALVGQLGSGLAQLDSLDEAAARILGTEQLFEATRRSLVQQSGSVWAEMQAYEEQLPDLTEVARQNEEIVASFIRQYIAGRKTWLDVLNSERELTQSRLTLADTRAAAISAQSRMARLAGLIRFDAATGEQR